MRKVRLAVRHIHIQADNSLSMTLQNIEGKNARPADILSNVFEFPEEMIKKALIVKTGATRNSVV